MMDKTTKKKRIAVTTLQKLLHQKINTIREPISDVCTCTVAVHWIQLHCIRGERFKQSRTSMTSSRKRLHWWFSCFYTLPCVCYFIHNVISTSVEIYHRNLPCYYLAVSNMWGVDPETGWSRVHIMLYTWDITSTMET